MNTEWKIRFIMAIACSITLIVYVLFMKRSKTTIEMKTSLILIAMLAMTSQVLSGLTHIDAMYLPLKTVEILRYAEHILIGGCCGIFLSLWIFGQFKFRK